MEKLQPLFLGTDFDYQKQSCVSKFSDAFGLSSFCCRDRNVIHDKWILLLVQNCWLGSWRKARRWLFSKKPNLNIKTNHSNVFFVRFDLSGIAGNEWKARNDNRAVVYNLTLHLHLDCRNVVCSIGEKQLSFQGKVISLCTFWLIWSP